MSQKSFKPTSSFNLLHTVGLIYVSAFAFCLVGATIASALGYLPWLDVIFATASGPIQAGPAMQLALAALGVALLFFLPSASRLMSLEEAHREFHMTMEDVADAYAASHEADRVGIFNLSSEFDSVRERITYMREHPDLAKLEPQILEVAAQMSHTSRDLARVYNHESVDRAKAVLRQRQVEMEEFTDQLQMAKRHTDELKRWSTQLEVEGSVATTQLDQLKKGLGEILPALGLKVIKSQKKTTEEVKKPRSKSTGKKAAASASNIV